MYVSSAQNSSNYTTTPTTQNGSASDDFASYFAGAGTGSSDDGLEAFMAYAKETPAQRLFDNWLGSQHITMAQYNSMPPAEKQKLVQEFEQYEKQSLKGELTTSTSAA